MLWIMVLLLVLFAGMEYTGREQLQALNKIFAGVAVAIIVIPPVVSYLLFKNFTALNSVSILLGVVQVCVLAVVYFIFRKVALND
ncbi:hypothetical protein NX781_04595 [Lactobacillus kullabergensis]|uniref:hypothetical protein n=1 Tax=Lactobacillus kullabergensis TaxID=1218493 RepID=UPI002247116F|nr:hypothetical protein [Lactobacillus kullabergensis]MCX0291066.1 hypothetical protein [Lactobacillus kullabergensis]